MISEPTLNGHEPAPSAPPVKPKKPPHGRGRAKVDVSAIEKLLGKQMAELARHGKPRIDKQGKPKRDEKGKKLYSPTNNADKRLVLDYCKHIRGLRGGAAPGDQTMDLAREAERRGLVGDDEE